MRRCSREELQDISGLTETNPSLALDRLRILRTECPEDVNLTNNFGGLLIDIGCELQDAALIKEGIAHLLCLRQESGGGLAPHLNYNLANGYYCLHDLACRESASEWTFDPDASPLLDARRYYLLAADGEAILDPHTRANLHVNYGNCLSGLRRTLEAIQEYDRAISLDGQHKMAWGNLGIEIDYFANIAQDWRTVQDAARFLENALDGDRLQGVRQRDFREALRRIQARLGSGKACRDCCAPQARSDATPTPYTDFCLNHGLFLNLNLKHCRPIQPLSDCFGFNFTTAIDDQATFPRYMRVVNEIKERYAVARFLLFESSSEHWSNVEIDNLTSYVDCLDYGIYGVRVGKLKLAFEAAFGTLDKIALLANRYLRLHANERHIHFDTFLLSDPRGRDSGLHAQVHALRNPFLFGLYSVSQDLRPEKPYSHFKEIRNSLAHRYLVPHVEEWSGTVEGDDNESHLTYGDLFHHSLDLMRLVRSATVYLIAFIDHEERRRHFTDGTLAVNKPTPVASPYPHGPI